jgi:hypothetical protein
MIVDASRQRFEIVGEAIHRLGDLGLGRAHEKSLQVRP